MAVICRPSDPRGWSCRDAGQHSTNPGHPGKSGTGGNPMWGQDPYREGAFVEEYFGIPRHARERHSLPYSIEDSSDAASGYLYCIPEFIKARRTSVIL